jgi:hypothetical protein
VAEQGTFNPLVVGSNPTRLADAESGGWQRGVVTNLMVRIRRSSLGLGLAMIGCPLLLSGCLVAWWPFSAARVPPSAPSPAPTAVARPSSPPDVYPVPDLPIVDLPGAPALAVWSFDQNAQIRLSIWRSGSLDDVLVVPLLNQDLVYSDHIRVSVSPTADFFAVTEAADGPTISRAFVRIFSIAGELVWTGPRDIWGAHPALRWSPDGRRLAIDAVDRWIVVTPAAPPATAATIEIDTRRPRLAEDQAAYPWQLLGISEDGATLFGSRSAGLMAYTFPLARASARGGPIEPLAALPTKPGRRLAPLPAIGDAALAAPIDPETGRIAMVTASGGVGDAQITLRAGTRTRSFTIPVSHAGVVQPVWTNGSLVILHDDDSEATVTQKLGLFGTKADLGKERRLAQFDILRQHATIVAVTDGYVVLAFGRGLPEVSNRLLLVSLADGAQTAIDADGRPETVERFGFAGWVPD